MRESERAGTAPPRLLGGRFLTMAWIACLTLALYWPAVDHAFVNLDDEKYVVQNPHVRTGLSWEGLSWAFSSVGYEANWHPLTWLSHMLDVELFGMHPGRHHLVNIILHAGNAALLFGLLQQMTGAFWRSSFVALLFAVHPLHVESVAWVAERKDVLSTLFWMLTLTTYHWYVRTRTRWSYVVVLIGLATGLLAKPMLVTLPLVLLLLDYWPLGRMAQAPHVEGRKRQGIVREFLPLLKEKIPLIAIALASGVITLIAQYKAGAIKSVQNYPLVTRAANAAVAYATYVIDLFWPMNLAVYYPHPGDTLAPAKIAGAAILVAGITVVVLRMAARRRYLVVGWFWFLISLAPVIGIVQAGGQARADRYTYVPLIGLFIMLAWGIPDLIRRRNFRPWLLVVPGAVVAVLGVMTRQQISHWRNSETLFTHALAVTRANWLAHNLLGLALYDQKRLTAALERYEAALAIAPRNADIHLNYGSALSAAGRVVEAEAEYRKALQFRPDLAEAYNNLGKIYLDQGRAAEAAAHFQKALEISPDLAEAHSNLGTALHNKGQREEAIAEYRAALKLKPDLVEAYNNLGNALDEAGRIQEAIDQYKKALAVAPTIPALHYNLAVALERDGRVEESIRHYREALRLAPNNAQARVRLENALRRR